ncbi:MAG: branched-chain amino acid ABC transporter permease [Deltaproteobacteria bacterium]|nr:branched-chain amino acid ABC transporter permease [Deltaproteobacteria bacterium]MBW1960605.1 branched-chain amino acid ABC transporter permease [Deltaproteobacteria bacterium]MBW1993994.1 branched-chain amino acid ABC transporter permease [Deltaproteobacteria bacterium]MBW2151125.1 branched-chain amino acid ABC transporter permease [Deltaproteobacteria bacterium]
MLKFRKMPVAMFGAFIVLFPWVAPGIAGIDHYPDIMVFAGIYCMITIGLSLLLGYAGQISLGHAAFYGIGAYTSAILTTHYGINPWICMLIGMIISASVAMVVGVPSMKLRGHYLAMATLSFGIIIYIIFNEEAEWTGGPDGMTGIPGLSIFGLQLDSIEKYYYLVWSFVFAALIFTINIIQSPTGRALRAIHASEAAANAVGINVSRFKVIVFIYSAILASIAGSLYAHYLNFINPSSFDLFFAIKLLIMIALGGMHHIWGAILGAFLITFLSYEWLHYFEEYEVIVYGFILLFVTIFLPDGLAGLPAIIGQRVRRKRSGAGGI